MRDNNSVIVNLLVIFAIRISYLGALTPFSSMIIELTNRKKK